MSSQENQLYEFGPYVIDGRSRILLKEGTTVRLTPKAFDTLFVLVQRYRRRSHGRARWREAGLSDRRGRQLGDLHDKR